MADAVFPNQHMTQTTVITSNTQLDTALRFDTHYITTTQGQLKVVEIIISLIAFLTITFSGKYALLDKSSFFAFIAGTAFWWTSILLGLYLFHVVEKFYKIPWLQIELIACCICAAFFILASILIFQYITESFIFFFLIIFGACTAAAYGYDAYIKMIALREGEIAQGNRVVSKQIVHPNPPQRY